MERELDQGARVEVQEDERGEEGEEERFLSFLRWAWRRERVRGAP